jgi:hypothetical protein
MAFLKNKDLVSELICRQELLNKVKQEELTEDYELMSD